MAGNSAGWLAHVCVWRGARAHRYHFNHLHWTQWANRGFAQSPITLSRARTTQYQQDGGRMEPSESTIPAGKTHSCYLDRKYLFVFLQRWLFMSSKRDIDTCATFKSLFFSLDTARNDFIKSVFVLFFSKTAKHSWIKIHLFETIILFIYFNPLRDFMLKTLMNICRWGKKTHFPFEFSLFFLSHWQIFLVLSTSSLSAIVHPKMKICWKCAHHQAIQDVDEFVSSSDLEKCSIPSLSHQWSLCSEWVPSEWESKQLIKASQ